MAATIWRPPCKRSRSVSKYKCLSQTNPQWFIFVIFTELKHADVYFIPFSAIRSVNLPWRKPVTDAKLIYIQLPRLCLNVLAYFLSYYQLTTCRTRTKQTCNDHAIKHCADFPGRVAPLRRGYSRILRFQSNSVGRRSPQSSFSRVAFIRQPSCWLYKETSFKNEAPGEPRGGGAGNLFLIDVYTIKAERCLHWVIGEAAEVWLHPAADETCSVMMRLRGENCEGAVFTPPDEVAVWNDPMCHRHCGRICGSLWTVNNAATCEDREYERFCTIWEPLGRRNLEHAGFYETKRTLQELQWEFGSKTLSETNKSWHKSIKSEEKPICNSSKPKKVRRGIRMLLIECSSEFITQCDLN